MLAALALAACDAPVPADTLIFVAPENEAVIRAYVERLPPELDAGVRVAADPAAAMAASMEGVRRVALTTDLAACDGCYTLVEAEGGVIASGDAPLGIQYGLSHWFEAMGVRFFHPSRTFVPAVLSGVAPDALGAHAPEIAERGLQLHTLHPIEAYFDFWEPGEDNLADAERTLHWLVCNRGNFLTYPALNDIALNETSRAAWREHTRAILDAAHLRGVRMGIGIQLFGRSSLQRALVLVPEEGTDASAQIDTRLALLEGLPYDSFNLAFGEFFGAEPERFVSTVEAAYDGIHARWPDAEVTATVHVGDFPDTRITYMGEEQLYYFLVRYAERPIVPWLHTVMYYTLFEPAGGAYNHEDFFEHRDYLLEEMRAARPAGYHPETAYWIAFDNSLPMYLPLYVRSRWFDLDQLRLADAGPLSSHVVFSSGWEWGYWQSDVAVLRTSYELPESDDAIFEEMFAPLEGGAELARVASELADILHGGLMEEGLAAYLASTDLTFALGVAMDFWSQPRRIELEDLLRMEPAALDAFETDVVEPLASLRDELRALRDGMADVGEEPFARELRDGVEIDVARAEFAAAIWSGALMAARGGSPDAALAEARTARAAAEVIVTRRHAALFDRDGATLIRNRVTTSGLYQYGYLREANRLCFYDRELAQLENEALGMSLVVPGCVL